ncbi:sprouty-related, EVH1 domain-containing protein 1 [Hyposmocoma kahamanoa]|uniref:sprouty-related, EVH1 domain-containing protein 1 n=1 Tax=Hyposmocoma kahamanoa TaxID=1477025 RepID=UPI000E6D691A|nr:sprouty-related, EVH1 domain-containing protein 1 [Hyposmocoma kahamanoa]
MTEASENAYLVRVRAQVMCRDEGTGGWLALGGGGLAHVMVGRRRATTHSHHHAHSHLNGNGGDSTETTSSSTAPVHEYFIHGRRISDNMVVLECTIKKDFQYNKVMPTFHHWVTDEKRFGLTFQTAADARAFDKGVRTAIEELLDGFLHGLGGAWPSLHAYKQLNPAPKDDDEENNIFECLNLPTESRSSSENSTASRPRARDPQILSAVTLPLHPPPESLQYEEPKLDEDSSDRFARPTYVQLNPIHDYQYPGMGAGVGSEKTSPNTKPPLLKRDSGSIKKCGYSGPPPLPDKKPAETFQARLKCRHCHEWYLESANRAGACEFAPDCFKSCIDAVSCIKCAQCMLYHCMSDSEGEYVSRPCSCAPADHACAKRWVGLALLSLVVPCLCCYLPLAGARAAARAARLAGGQHAPAQPPPRNADSADSADVVVHPPTPHPLDGDLQYIDDSE